MRTPLVFEGAQFAGTQQVVVNRPDTAIPPRPAKRGEGRGEGGVCPRGCTLIEAKGPDPLPRLPPLDWRMGLVFPKRPNRAHGHQFAVYSDNTEARRRR